MAKGNGADFSKEERVDSWAGCYGPRLKASKLINFLERGFEYNRRAEQNGFPKTTTCIWGHPGTGKTTIGRDFHKMGYDVTIIPLAQFDEMGDITGVPDDFICMEYFEENKKAGEKDTVSREWVMAKDSIIQSYLDNGWSVSHKIPPVTRTAQPIWVPTRAGKSILVFDDWNRAGGRILKGVMQLIQDYRMVAWRLPPGCNIVLTGNPDMQDYQVTFVDPAVLTRLRNVTLRHDAIEWAYWADHHGVDSRVINWILSYPDMLIGREFTNPRTITEFAGLISDIRDINLSSGDIMDEGRAKLDDESVSSFIAFSTKEMDKLIDPEDVLRDFEKYRSKFVEWAKPESGRKKESRIDIIGIEFERIFAYITRPDYKPQKKHIESFQKLFTMKKIPEDLRMIILRRVAEAAREDNKSHYFVVKNPDIRDMVAQLIR